MRILEHHPSMPMSDEAPYVERLLIALEEQARGNRRPRLAAAITGIAKRIATATDPRFVMDDLAAVAEWNEFALRLMWCANERATLRPEADEPSLFQLHLDELRTASASCVKEVRAEAPPRSVDFDEALLEFGKAAEGIKRGSYQNEHFSGIPRAQLDIVRQHAENLKRVAAAEGNQDVQKFCAAFILFLEYASDQDLLRDIRVVNLLDNANLTIQTVHQAVGAEEYDSLHQMIELLENPGTLLE